MSPINYRPSEAVALAIDVMSAIYAFPPPRIPPPPWLVHGLDMRDIRRELRRSCAGSSAAQVRAMQAAVVDLSVIRQRRVVYCVRRQGVVSAIISMLHSMANAGIDDFLRGHLTVGEFDRIDAAAQLLCYAQLRLAEMVAPADITQVIDSESASDPQTLIVCDYPVAAQLRRQCYRSPLPILCPSATGR